MNIYRFKDDIEKVMFVRSAYWQRWSRVLGRDGRDIVEVNLTPIPGCYSSSWENDVAPIRIRFHGTARSRNDLILADLPEDVKAQMVAHLGEELTERLLSENFLSQIDRSKYNQVCNGGANLADILK